MRYEIDTLETTATFLSSEAEIEIKVISVDYDIDEQKTTIRFEQRMEGQREDGEYYRTCVGLLTIPELLKEVRENMFRPSAY